jgi:hypothetical protein
MRQAVLIVLTLIVLAFYLVLFREPIAKWYRQSEQKLSSEDYLREPLAGDLIEWDIDVNRSREALYGRK